ncbi:MAG: UvrD-helicase domain-containing protein [Alistipes sp.]|nr:UvrD-helicase domain-containing protein [Candidatus Alistipes equi]
MNIDLYAELNDVQRKVVETTEGFLRVIAGAGTGKTRTITMRYIYLTNELGISPHNILCVTFTNKAAEEMRSRISKNVPEALGEFICTYHSLAIKILHQDIVRVGFPVSFTVLDEEDQKDILKQIYTEQKISKRDYPISDTIDYIAGKKHDTPYIKDYMEVCPKEKQDAFLSCNDDILWKIFAEYLKIQKKNFYLDFEDLMYFALYILETYADIREYWQKKFDYIMVDECQDNNDTQWKIIDILAQKYKNMMAVGDPDQCIYEWRGSRPVSLVDFDKTHTPCQTFILNENYRSTPNILDVANCVIRNNQQRIPKDLYTYRKPVENVTYFHAVNEEHEGEFVASTIVELNLKGFSYSDFTVLYRAAHLSRAIEQELIKSNIPYKVYAGINFFLRKEIKDIFAYLRTVNSMDYTSTLRIINVPSRKLGKVYLSNLIQKAKEDNATLIDTILGHKDDAKIGKVSAIEFAQMIVDIRNEIKGMSLSDLFQHILERCGLKKMYSEKDDTDRLENISELMQLVNTYEQEHPQNDLALFIQEMSLYTNQDIDKNSDHVKLMTIHQAKGLEFPIVFTIGMNEGVLPSIYSIRNPYDNNLEEERRLTYVAFTRARDYLFITEHEGYNYRTEEHCTPSRFIMEIERNMLIRKGHMSKIIEDRMREMAKVLPKTENLNANMDSYSKYYVGQEIEHRIFGTGTIVAINLSNDIAIIRFDSRDELKHLKLSKLDAITIIKI